MRVLKWTSVTEYIDGSTGEILTPSDAKRNYLIIKKTKHYDFIVKKARDTKELYKEGKITYINHCQRNSQQRLFND